MIFTHQKLLAAIQKACPELMEYDCAACNGKAYNAPCPKMSGSTDPVPHIPVNLLPEPQLANVLRAIEKTVGSKQIYWTIDTTGNIFGVDEVDPVELNNFPAVDHFIKHISGAKWDLTLGLYGQEPATLDFLTQLLCEN